MKQKLLKTKLTEDDVAGFKERNLNDTRYITSFIHKYISENLKLTGKYKKGVFCRNGKIHSLSRALKLIVCKPKRNHELNSFHFSSPPFL